MSVFQTSFDWASNLYADWFADWLHISFIIRTVILALMLLIVIFVAGQLFKYVLGPIIVLIYVHIFKRMWNFFITESIHEWLYIRYYSKDNVEYSNVYLNLCDKVKRNRAVLKYTGYRSILRNGRVRKLGNGLIISLCVISVMWVVAFGLSDEYAQLAVAIVEPPQTDGPTPPAGTTNNDDVDNEHQNEAERIPSYTVYYPGFIIPALLPPGTQIMLTLTDNAREGGARLRDGPGISGFTVIEVLWGYDLLIYLGNYVQDEDVDMLYWLHVLSPTGLEGYIASQLVEVVDR